MKSDSFKILNDNIVPRTFISNWSNFLVLILVLIAAIMTKKPAFLFRYDNENKFLQSSDDVR